MKIDGGNLLGKIIILSFSDNENTLYSSIISVLASVADFSTVAASTDAPLLFGSLQIDPAQVGLAGRPDGGSDADGV